MFVNAQQDGLPQFRLCVDTTRLPEKENVKTLWDSFRKTIHQGAIYCKTAPDC